MQSNIKTDNLGELHSSVKQLTELFYREKSFNISMDVLTKAGDNYSDARGIMFEKLNHRDAQRVTEEKNAV